MAGVVYRRFYVFFYSPLDTLVPEKYHRLKRDWRCSRFALLSKYKAMSYDPHDTWFLWVCVRIASSLPSFPLLFSIQSSPPSHSGNVPLPIASPLRLTKARHSSVFPRTCSRGTLWVRIPSPAFPLTSVYHFFSLCSNRYSSVQSHSTFGCSFPFFSISAYRENWHLYEQYEKPQHFM